QTVGQSTRSLAGFPWLSQAWLCKVLLTFGHINFADKNPPKRDKQGCNQGADHEPVYPKHTQAAQSRKEDDIVGELGVAPHQYRAYQVIDKANYPCPETGEDQGFNAFTGCEQVDRNGQPNDGRSNRGN